MFKFNFDIDDEDLEVTDANLTNQTDFASSSTSIPEVTGSAFNEVNLSSLVLSFVCGSKSMLKSPFQVD